MRQAVAAQVAGLAAFAAGILVLFGAGWFLVAVGAGLFGVGLLLEHGARGKGPA